jgi:hypothetical protein
MSSELFSGRFFKTASLFVFFLKPGYWLGDPPWNFSQRALPSA